MNDPVHTMTRHLVLTILLLSACGGSSGDNAPGGTPPAQQPAQQPVIPLPAQQPAQQPVIPPAAMPTVNAGGDQIVRLGDSVTLSGSSTTTEAHPSYLWQFVSVPTGSNVVLADPTMLTPSFTPDRVGLYVISLTLSAGPSDQVTVEVSR